MRLLGHSKLDERFKEVLVGTAEGKPVVLRVYAPRLGENSRLMELVPNPLPPVIETVRDARGRPIKNAKGQVEVRRDDQDPSFLKKLEDAQQARGVGLVLSCLRDQIDTELSLPDFPTPQAYFLAVRDALGDFGFDMGVWDALDKAVGELLQINDDEIECAEAELGGE